MRTTHVVSALRRGGLVGLLAVALAAPAVAAAAPTSYVLQVTGNSMNASLAMDGDQVTNFSVEVAPNKCTSGRPADSPSSLFAVVLPGDQGAVLDPHGSFAFSGDAAASHFSSGDAQFAVKGEASPDRRLLSGTITITAGHDPNLGGCSGIYRFGAIPKPSSSPQYGASANRDLSSRFVSFDYRAGRVSLLQAEANFHCGGGPYPSTDSAELDLHAYGLPLVPVSKTGAFAVHTNVLDEYGSIVHIDFSGRITAGRASGRIQVSEPAGLRSSSGQMCSGSYKWSASRHAAATGPVAYFDWNAARVPVSGGYRYYFFVSGITCAGGATAIRFLVNGRLTQVPCSAHVAWASGPLHAGQLYNTRAQAVRIVKGRMVRRGKSLTEPLQVPPANANWGSGAGAPPNPPK